MIGYGKRVLLVDDMKTVRQSLAGMLEDDGFIVVQAQDGVQALREMQLRHFDTVVTDYHIPPLDGLALLRQCRMAWPEMPVIFFAEIDWEKESLARAQGAFAWIRKSSDPGVLLSMLVLAVEHGVECRSMQATERVGA